MLKPVLKRAIQLIAEDYWNGWIYVCEPEGMELPASGGLRFSPIDDVSRILQSPDPALRRQAWKREADAWAFGASVGDELAAVCWFQARETYRRHGGLFKLGANEAELVQITTAEAFRGRGLCCAGSGVIGAINRRDWGALRRRKRRSAAISSSPAEKRIISPIGTDYTAKAAKRPL